MWVILEDLGNFSPKKEKNLGEQKFTSFGVEFLRIVPLQFQGQCYETFFVN
jgi:DNA mismatch repair protein MutH